MVCLVRFIYLIRLEMFDTLKLIYTQDEAFELVSRYEEAYKEKIKELEERKR